MSAALQILAAATLLALALGPLGGCSCGFDCSGGGNQNPTQLSLGFSDESLEQLKQVVIEVDSISFRRTGAEDVVVERFTIPALGLVDADTFQVDLLEYQGLNQLLVIQDMELEARTYNQLAIGILGGDINRSYVQESSDQLKVLSVSAGELVLGGPSLASGQQQFTVAFSLPQALLFEASSDSYRLTTNGIRLADNASAASLTGRVDSTLFNTVAPCDTKSDPESGNRLYLYSGRSLSADKLADVYTSNSSSEIPAAAIAPFAVGALAQDTLTGGWQYAFGFIPAGEYSLAFACDAADDDPVDYNGIAIPLPTDQLYNISLSASQKAICDIGSGASCK